MKQGSLGRQSLVGLMLWMLLGGLATGAENPPDRIFSANELALLDRENTWWRMVRANADVPDILQMWRDAGCTEEEVAALTPRLAGLWEVTATRHYGWLHEETVEQIKQVDREFIVRMRAVRLRQTTGVQLTGHTAVSSKEVDRQWRQAILRVLDHDEVAEFMFMNSVAAREAVRLTEGIDLSSDEQRRLFLWHREFDLAHERAGLPPGRPRDPAWRDSWLDHLARVQDLLGAERFAVYLGRAEPGFGELRPALAHVGAADARLAVEVWWVRQRLDLAHARHSLSTINNVREADARAQAQVSTVLGEERFRRYAEDDGSLWLFSTKRWQREAMRRGAR